MARFFAGLIAGLLAGAALVYFFLVGVPDPATRPGAPVQPPEAATVPASAQLVIRQDLLNAALSTIFRELRPPTFQIGNAAGDCPNSITILQAGSGVSTSVQFANDRLNAPLAFNGNYSSPVGCIPFAGWAQTNLELRFDKPSQTVFGVLNVESVSLEGVDAVWSGLITPFVQSTINTQVNPIKLLDQKQLAIDLPVAASGGNLKAGIGDVRAEMRDNALNLFVVYDFENAQPQAAR